ncbi:cell division protein FtsN [Enterobacteriaceae bacterium YMB-R22]|uniref:cell division protein FtsN n=1 Tax=Tenebrionicola larvae TaxID=2815733 RepID=UPI0020125A48|nr:cell division protein FtsN [Tenebrionicola larvae]MBV4414226.1 cell division protein FtsN [Tenebrionicola larvae]
MAQRDYVRRGQPSPARRKSPSRKKKGRSSGVSPVMAAIAVAVLAAFIGGLWFITHHKKEEVETLPGQKATGNGLPPKPEERWRYIKELETRQPGVARPTEPSAGGEIIHQDQLTDEQRQLLEQMQADMRQQPTQLSEVPWNEQTPAQRQQTLQHQRLNQAQRQAQLKEPAITRQQPEQQRKQQEQRLSRQRQSELQRQQQELQRTTQRAAQAQQLSEGNGAQQTQPKNQPAPVTAAAQASSVKPQAAAKKDERQYMVQCGSFKGAEPAQKVRAQLAFEGFDSHITVNNGWNRVVIGPLNGKDSANSTLNRLKASGHTNCIRVAAGG